MNIPLSEVNRRIAEDDGSDLVDWLADVEKIIDKAEGRS
jgi:hypothetical protein